MTPPVEVLIAGGGPVGLALAIELGRYGVRCLLVDEGDGTINYITANLVNTRSVELLRRWGLAEKVRFSAFPPNYPRTYVFLTSFNGYELVRFEHPANGDPASATPHSPEWRLWCPKVYFDPILREHASTLPTVEVRLRTRFERFDEGSEGMSAQLMDVETGVMERVSARYLVACDGGRSIIRRQLGIKLQGTFSEDTNLAILVRAPLHDYQSHGKVVYFGLTNPRSRATVTSVDGERLWRVNAHDVDNTDPSHVVRSALGDQVPFEIVSAFQWSGHFAVAERYSAGPVYLAGDAAHLNWPAGAFGMNTGLGDAVDLAWKLAATLRGWGADGLLSSYEAERRPIALHNVGESKGLRTSQDSLSISPLIEADTPEGAAFRERMSAHIVQTRAKEFAVGSIGVELGYHYATSRICVQDDTATAPPWVHEEYTPSTVPGVRAPHAWITGGRSTLDLFGEGFTLLKRAPVADSGSLEAAAAQRGLPLRVHVLPDSAQVYDRPLVLVRPDGHVAWRGDAPPVDPLRIIDTVRGAA